MRYRFQQFMMGRYGMDQLGIALLVLSFAVSLVLRPFHLPILPMCLNSAYRLWLSDLFPDIVRAGGKMRNFCACGAPIWSILFRYYRRHVTSGIPLLPLPKRKGELRVPKGNGKNPHQLPRCRQEFIKKT
jgi:hypothetical protein